MAFAKSSSRGKVLMRLCFPDMRHYGRSARKTPIAALYGIIETADEVRSRPLTLRLRPQAADAGAQSGEGTGKPAILELVFQRAVTGATIMPAAALPFRLIQRNGVLCFRAVHKSGIDVLGHGHRSFDGIRGGCRPARLDPGQIVILRAAA
jgi:hypothetical protein